jgi:UDP-3-O-[3-hydroxymyristoyl] glucosamine N-acyltransferase
MNFSINQELLYSVLAIKTSSDVSFVGLGLSNVTVPNTLSFYDDIRFLSQLNDNVNVTGVFVDEENKNLIDNSKAKFIVKDPRWNYYTLQNYLAKKNKKQFISLLDTSAVIHKTAYVAERNVIIGKNCIINAHATILEDVELGDNCVIQSGAVLGSEGFEYKRVKNGILPVYHDGKAIIGNFVDIGANTCIDKGFSFRDTIIGDETKIDNLVHIGHSANIGKRCFIAACAQIGAVSMGDDVWVGPSVNLLSGQKIGESSFITVGSVVTKDVLENQKVTGYFAVPHEEFIKKLKGTSH